MTTLDNRLLAAHARQDWDALIRLYAQAADATDDIDAACFYLTHAYVFALERDHKDVARLHERLARHGRV